MNKYIKPWQENNITCFTTTKLMEPLVKHQTPRNFQNVVKAEQIHHNTVIVVTKSDSGKIIKNADGLVTKDKNLFLLIYTADCIPVFLYDAINNIIGLTHAGRRGSLKNISGNTVEKMKKMGAKTDSIKVYLGPHICNKCYETNLAQINISQLRESGILSKNISISPYCTFEDHELFYSYRRDKPLEKIFPEMLSIIGLNEL